MCFPLVKKGANQPAMWNHRGAGLIPVIIFPLLYKISCKALKTILKRRSHMSGFKICVD